MLFTSSHNFQVQESQASSSTAAGIGRGRGPAGSGRGAAVQPDYGHNRSYGRSSSGRMHSWFTVGASATARDGGAREE